MSKVILYMAASVNGMIANENDNTSWISIEEWNSYSEAVRKAGNLIIGHRTYDILTKQPEFSEFKDVNIAAVATSPLELVDTEKHIVVASPEAALEHFKDAQEVVVAGGGILNASFMENNLVDELIIDIEPIALGKGIKLFNGNDFAKDLKLIETKKISDNEIQLHYQVIK